MLLISGHSDRETPGPIPNPEVKTVSALVGTEFLLGASWTLLIILSLTFSRNFFWMILTDILTRITLILGSEKSGILFRVFEYTFLKES